MLISKWKPYDVYFQVMQKYQPWGMQPCMTAQCPPLKRWLLFPGLSSFHPQGDTAHQSWQLRHLLRMLKVDISHIWHWCKCALDILGSQVRSHGWDNVSKSFRIFTQNTKPSALRALIFQFPINFLGFYWWHGRWWCRLIREYRTSPGVWRSRVDWDCNAEINRNGVCNKSIYMYIKYSSTPSRMYICICIYIYDISIYYSHTLTA